MTAIFKKMKKVLFLAADFGKCKKEKTLNSPNLSNIARGILTQFTGHGRGYSRKYVSNCENC